MSARRNNSNYCYAATRGLASVHAVPMYNKNAPPKRVETARLIRSPEFALYLGTVRSLVQGSRLVTSAYERLLSEEPEAGWVRLALRHLKVLVVPDPEPIPDDVVARRAVADELRRGRELARARKQAMRDEPRGEIPSRLTLAEARRLLSRPR